MDNTWATAIGYKQKAEWRHFIAKEHRKTSVGDFFRDGEAMDLLINS